MLKLDVCPEVIDDKDNWVPTISLTLGKERESVNITILQFRRVYFEPLSMRLM